MQKSKLKLTRLQDNQVKGSFALNCETNEQFIRLQTFFITSNDFVKFKSIPAIGEFKQKQWISHIYTPLLVCGDKRLKFLIKYESLNELLKLREIFKARGNKFDMYLIKKRGYDMFTPEFFEKCADKTIYKVIT